MGAVVSKRLESHPWDPGDTCPQGTLEDNHHHKTTKLHHLLSSLSLHQVRGQVEGTSVAFDQGSGEGWHFEGTSSSSIEDGYLMVEVLDQQQLEALDVDKSTGIHPSEESRLEVPETLAEALEFDARVGATSWQESIEREMEAIQFCFEAVAEEPSIQEVDGWSDCCLNPLSLVPLGDSR